MNTKTQIIVLLASLIVTQTGCFAVANLDRFEIAADGGTTEMDAGSDAGTDADAGEDGGLISVPRMCTSGGTNSSPFRDFRMSLIAMTHKDKYTEVRIVDQSGGATRGRLEAIAIFDGLPDESPLASPERLVADTFVFMPGAITQGPFRVDFWADSANNDNHMLDPDSHTQAMAPSDHAWSASTADPGPLSPDSMVEGGCAIFNHNTTFANLADTATFPVNPGRDVRVHFTGFSGVRGSAAELRVMVPGQLQTIGLYRLQAIRTDSEGSFDINVPGIGALTESYDIEFYIDQDNNFLWSESESGWVIDSAELRAGVPIELDFAMSNTRLSYP